MLKRTREKQVDNDSIKVGLSSEHALCRLKWIVGVNKVANGLR